MDKKCILFCNFEESKLKITSIFKIIEKKTKKKLKKNRKFYANLVFDKIDFVFLFCITEK